MKGGDWLMNNNQDCEICKLDYDLRVQHEIHPGMLRGQKGGEAHSEEFQDDSYEKGEE